MTSIIYRKCKYCKMKRVPHRVMENRSDSYIICENCGKKYRRNTK